MRFRHPRTGSSVKSPSRRERPLPRTGSSPRSSFGDRRRLEEMPQALFLRPQVADVRGGEAKPRGGAFSYVEAGATERPNLVGVGRHPLDRSYTQDPRPSFGLLVT